MVGVCNAADPTDNAGLFDEQRYGPASETVPAWVEEIVAVGSRDR